MMNAISCVQNTEVTLGRALRALLLKPLFFFFGISQKNVTRKSAALPETWRGVGLFADRDTGGRKASLIQGTRSNRQIDFQGVS